MVARPPPRTPQAPLVSSPHHIYATAQPSTQTLQLWVEHGLNISARSGILMSRLNAHHAAAKNEQLTTSLQDIFPGADSPKRPSARPSSPRLTVTRDLEKRRVLRTLRHRKLQHILKREEERRLRQRRAEERAAAEQRQRALAAEQQQKTRLAAANRQHAQEAAAPPAQKPKPKPTDRRVSFGGVSIAGEPLQGPAVALKPEQSAALRTPQPAKQTAPSGGTGFLPEVEKALQVWTQVSADADSFRQNFAMKKARLSLKKHINLAVNQIAASVKQVTNKVRDLSKLVNDTRQIGGSSGQSFAMKEIAQRLIAEADGSVALSRTTAFAVASVIVGVAASVSDVQKMRDVFLAAFYKHCMYTMPSYSRRRKDESVEDYRTRIGYKEEETVESYLERMCGCVNLFAAVLQTDQVHTGSHFGAPAQNPFSLDLGWSWLARIVNTEQRSITPAIVFAFLETAGYGMAKRFRKQFAKLMAMVQQVVVLKAVKAAPKGPTSRLDIYISDFIAEGCVISSLPEGRTLPTTDAEFL